MEGTVRYDEQTTTFELKLQMPPAMFRRLVEVLCSAEGVDDEAVNDRTKTMLKSLAGIVRSNLVHDNVKAALGEELWNELEAWWLA
jgi:hypothetical protein